VQIHEERANIIVSGASSAMVQSREGAWSQIFDEWPGTSNGSYQEMKRASAPGLSLWHEEETESWTYQESGEIPMLSQRRNFNVGPLKR
jgi:hypothetical protein